MSIDADTKEQAAEALRKVMHERCSNFDRGAVVHWAERGYYVTADEITALRARLAQVEKERDEWVRDVWTARGFQAEAEARAERAEAALATARREAYERAAQVAETAKAVCARCNSPEDNHPYRHPFIPVVMVNIPAATRALANEAPE